MHRGLRLETAVDVDAHPRGVQRPEKGEPENVVPVRVREKQVDAPRALVGEPVAGAADAGPGVDQQRFARTANLQTGRVAPMA